jgi:glutamate--cysteine ligase
MDVNAFHPLGIAEEQIFFVEALMLMCLLHESPAINVAEQKEIDWNELTAAHQGRKPGLMLQHNGERIPLQRWGLEICDALQPICEILDEAMQGRPYSESLMLQRCRLQDANQTPSARMLAEMRDRGESFFQFARRMSKQHQHTFMQQEHSSQDQQLLEQEAVDSRRRQQEMEASDRVGFDQFLEDYFSQTIDKDPSSDLEKRSISVL